MSTERLLLKLKHLPPSIHDNISDNELDTFNKVGAIGWQYLGDQIFHGADIKDKLEKISAKLEEMAAKEKTNLMKKIKKKKSPRKIRNIAFSKSVVGAGYAAETIATKSKNLLT